VSERKGLTAPSNAAEELQRLMREEHEEDRKSPSNEGSFQPSLEVSRPPAKEDRKETSFQDRKPQRVPQKKEALKLPSNEGRLESSEEGWGEDVKARAKAGSREERKVRLNVDIPASIHLTMKMWCLREGYNLNEVIPALVAAFLEGEEK